MTDILLVISGFLLLYLILVKVLRAFDDKRFDSYYKIKTSGLNDWDDKRVYNRTESTPYTVLEHLVHIYKPLKGKLVDFGAGKGRVSVFLSDRWGIDVVGVELEDRAYRQALENTKGRNVEIVKEYAESYQITNETSFFFFNPFNDLVFSRVLKNIKQSSELRNERVDVILYYPNKKYIKEIEKQGFELIKKSRVVPATHPDDKIMIYKYGG